MSLMPGRAEVKVTDVIYMCLALYVVSLQGGMLHVSWKHNTRQMQKLFISGNLANVTVTGHDTVLAEAQ